MDNLEQFKGRMTITLPEAAQATGLDKRTILSRIHSGILKAKRLPGSRKGGMWLIEFESFKNMIKAS
jgi:hypothetical protein